VRKGVGLSSVRLPIVPRRPYSLALTAERYARFPEAVDRFEAGVYRRLLPVGRGVLLSVEQEGPVSRAVLRATLEGPGASSPAARAAALRVVEVSLGAAVAVRPFYRAFAADPVIGAAIRDFRGLRAAGVPSLWEATLTAILSQQVNLKFAYDIRRELAETFGRRKRFGGRLYFAFPSPEALAGETPRTLRSFRLSRAKAKAIHGLAAAFAQGVVSEGEIAALPDEAAIERLTALPGVGRWTAEIALLRGLGRTDIFPAGDLGVVKYLAQGLLGHRAKAEEETMRRFALRWSPFRGLALVYAYAELRRLRLLGDLPFGHRAAARPAADSTAALVSSLRSGSRGARLRS
jgi:DNA-3-methyladenine glycosylase II